MAGKEMVFGRFDTGLRKNCVASVFMNIGGIHLEKKINFPQITQKKNQISNASLIFDSDFESGNLLFVFKEHNEHSGI